VRRTLLLALLVLVPVQPAGAHHWDDWRPEPAWTEEEPAAEAPDAGEDVAPEAPEDVVEAVDDLPLEPPVLGPVPELAPAAPSGGGGGGGGRAPGGDATGPGLRGVPYRALILQHARRRGLEPAFVAAIVRAESAFNRRAVSRVGARGLMQLMPATARGMGAKVSRLFDPATNIAYGTRYLQHVRAVVGRDPRRIAAGYNAGPGAVRRFGGIPPYAETRAYVRRVMAFRAAYRRAG
jgi:hypothetical protein